MTDAAQRNPLMKVLVGSRAHGLAGPDSDHDFRGVFYVPTCELLRATRGAPKSTSWTEGENDDTAWEVGHFLSLALHCNPTILETFAAPLVDFKEEMKDEVLSLRALLPSLWEPKRVATAHIGYGLNQRKKFLDDKDGRRAKYAVAYLRVLYQAVELLRVGDLVIDMTQTPVFETLKAWRRGEFEVGEVVQVTEKWADLVRWHEAHGPGNPKYNPDAADEWLLAFRKKHWHTFKGAFNES